MRQRWIFVLLTVVAALVVGARSGSSRPSPDRGPRLFPRALPANQSSLADKNTATVVQEQQPTETRGILTADGIYMSGPLDTGNTILTVGYLTAIKGELKDKQGLAISGAITIALDEVI